MRILLNERAIDISAPATVGDIVRSYKPKADVYILNGFPTLGTAVLSEGDRLVLIKRGEIPSPEELEVMLVSRHTPGVYEKLKKACIGIAGCGGLGSSAAVALSRAGVGKLIVADFDVVEPSNLNRQQYFVDQIGMPKVQALKENLVRMNPVVKVIAKKLRLTRVNIRSVFERADVIIEAFDKADQKAMLAEAVLTDLPGKPLILGLGMAGYGFNQILHSRDAGNLFICGDEVSEAGPNFGLMAPRVGLTAHMQANLALEIILGPDPQILKSLHKRKSE